MPVLTTHQRNALEAAVKQARKAAEQGAYNALQAMAIDHPEPFAHMDADARSLRNSLRSKARLLGDVMLPDGTQEMKNISYELAYETWHKMLFAKFLETNDLLMHPDGVAVTMADCEELCKEEGFADKWDAAANYASRMLPAIFRVDDPLMQVGYATNDRINLEGIIAGLEDAIFTADDALGWVYQFWQSEAKAAINASGAKIDGAKLPAVTQLFTEPYMVHFLIDNTLGAWWVGRNPGVKPPVKFAYLRLLEDGTPAAGKFEGWPDSTAAVTALDPCMGSGHFVASLFPVFAALRMQEEGLTKEEATDKVIAENLHGLELDPRCTQIAAFNLALTAWKFCGHYKELPEMNLACSGIAPKGKVEDWVKLVGKVERADDKLRMENGMKMLYEHFQLAPELGSLLDPTTIKADAFTASFEELQPVLKRALENEADTEQLERGVMAAGIAKAGQLLAKKYTLQITNVPYLGKGKFDTVLSDYVMQHYADAKSDLASVFIERLIKTASHSGVICSVMPHNWLFLTSYRKFREFLLKSARFNFVIRLGEHAFDNSEAAGAFACLFSLTNGIPNSGHQFYGINAYNIRGEKPIYASQKAELLKTAELKTVNQQEQLGNPNSVITLELIDADKLLDKYCYSHHGLTTGDLPRMAICFWELVNVDGKWIPFQTTTNKAMYYGGLEKILRWENGSGAINELPGARKDGTNAWGRKGIVISQMGVMSATIYLGSSYDNNTAVITPNDDEYFKAIWAYCSSDEYRLDLRKIDQKLSVTSGTLVKVPFNLNHWSKVAFEKYPNGLPKPYSDDPTQWLFHGHPIKTDNPLQVALARALGYRWPAESDTEMELADEAREYIAAVKAFDDLSDEDGIFCIPSVNTEQAGAERLRDYLQQVFSSAWNSQTIPQLLQKEGRRKRCRGFAECGP